MRTGVCIKYVEEYIQKITNLFGPDTPARMNAHIGSTNGKNDVIYDLFNKICGSNDICIIVFRDNKSIMKFCDDYILIKKHNEIKLDSGEKIIGCGIAKAEYSKIDLDRSDNSIDFSFIRYGKSTKYKKYFVENSNDVEYYFKNIWESTNKKTMVFVIYDDLDKLWKFIPEHYHNRHLFSMSIYTEIADTIKKIYRWDSDVKTVFSFIDEHGMFCHCKKINIGACIYHEELDKYYNDTKTDCLVNKFSSIYKSSSYYLDKISKNKKSIADFTRKIEKMLSEQTDENIPINPDSNIIDENIIDENIPINPDSNIIDENIPIKLENNITDENIFINLEDDIPNNVDSNIIDENIPIKLENNVTDENIFINLEDDIVDGSGSINLNSDDIHPHIEQNKSDNLIMVYPNNPMIEQNKSDNLIMVYPNNPMYEKLLEYHQRDQSHSLLIQIPEKSLKRKRNIMDDEYKQKDKRRRYE